MSIGWLEADPVSNARAHPEEFEVEEVDAGSAASEVKLNVWVLSVQVGGNDDKDSSRCSHSIRMSS